MEPRWRLEEGDCEGRDKAASRAAYSEGASLGTTGQRAGSAMQIGR